MAEEAGRDTSSSWGALANPAAEAGAAGADEQIVTDDCAEKVRTGGYKAADWAGKVKSELRQALRTSQKRTRQSQAGHDGERADGQVARDPIGRCQSQIRAAG